MTPDLKTSLDDLAEAAYAEAPVSTVDIDKARADGRRRVLAARLAPIGGGVAVVAACALVVNGLGGTSPAKTGGPDTSAAAGRHFTGTDPLTAVAKFGWLPDGYQSNAYTTGADYGDGVTAHAKPVAGDRTAESWSVAVFKSATEPQPTSSETKTEVSVKGSQKAYIYARHGDSPEIPEDLTLVWQTASGSWFSLQDELRLHGAALQAQLIRIADSVTAEDAAVPMPIHIEGLPQGVTLGEASLSDPVTADQRGLLAGLSYHSGNAGPGTGRYFSITVATPGLQDPVNALGDPDPRSKGAGSLTYTPQNNTCKVSEGLQICVQDDPKQPGPDPLASVGGAKGLLDRITSLGTDRANWTTHVVN